MNYRNCLIIILSMLFALSCGTPKNVAVTSNVTVSENGLVGKGVGVSKIERTSNSIAIRMARAELVSHINSVLSKIDQDYKLPSGAHSESILKGTKVIDSSSTIHKGDITTIAFVEWSNQEIKDWAESYYINLPEDDGIRSQFKQNEFISLILTYLQIKI